MNDGRRRALPWIVAVSVSLASVVSLALSWQDQGVLPFAPLGFVAIGTVILLRARNPIGWLFDVIAIGGGALTLTQMYLYRHATSWPGLPGAGYAAMFSQAAVVPVVAALAFLVLVFPNGRLPSRRWIPVGWAIAVSTLFVIASLLLRPGSTNANNAEGLVNPMGSARFADLADLLGKVGGWGLFLSALACVASLVVRFHRSTGEERQQLRWLAAAGAFAVVSFVLAALQLVAHAPVLVGNISWGLFILSLLVGVPVAVAIAVMKYRLYEIDVVIRKTVVFGLLAAFITVVYMAIVVGLGRLVHGTTALQIAATAVVAVAFQPVRDRANRIANRIVYGKRATPYEVLTRFADRMGDTYASEDVLTRIARVIAEGTGADRTEVWLRVGDEFRLAGAMPADRRDVLTMVADDLPLLEADHVAPVRHQGRLLGALTVTKPGSEPLTPNDIELIDRLADQCGLVLANVGLTTDLETRITQIERQTAELRASRQRIVAAQDEERRRLERNIHDGAQQHLVALAVKLRLARTVLDRDPEKGRAMLGEIRGQVDAALDTLGSLALGIYPPLLEEHGIEAAVATQYEHSGLPVRMQAGGIGRHSLEIEAAVYFCVLEALQNAAKYARAGSIDVRLRERDGALEFDVVDDGEGFDPTANGHGTGLAGMRDRLAVFGGSADITSAPGQGTTVRGRVPVGQRVES